MHVPASPFSRRHAVPALLALALLGAPAAGRAEETAALPEVTVTSSPLPSGDAPDGLGSARLADLQVRKPEDLSSVAPNLATLDSGANGFNSVTSFRGLANALYYTDPAVVYYVDDVPSSAAATNVFDPHAVDSIRLWKGPQTDRFGQNAPAGVIDVASAAPQSAFSSILTGDYGSYDRRDVFGQVTAPVPVPGGGLSALASGHYTAQDGILRNPTLGTRPDDTEETAGRLALRYAPVPDWTFDLNLAQTYDDDGSPRFTPLNGPRYQVDSRVPGQTDMENGVQSLRVRHDGDAMQATFVSSHSSFDLDPDLIDIGFGGTPVLANLTEHRQQYTEELRLASNPDGNGPVSWRAGAFYQHVDVHETSELSTTGTSTDTIINTHGDCYALSGQVAVKPCDRLTLAFGNRFQADDKGGRRNDVGTQPSVAAQEQRTWLNLAPKAEATYDATDALQLFASSALAFRPGGYAPFPGRIPTVQSYGTERGWANEIGVAAEGWGHRLHTRFSLFWNETYNYQLEIYSFPNSSVVNAPEVASRGAEWEAELEPVSHLTLRAAAGYTLATFVRYRNGAGQDDSGLNVPYVPRATWLLEATYRHPQGWVAHTDLRGLGDTDFSAENQPVDRQDAYALWNARIGYEAKRWAVYLHGENLADARYDTLIDTGIGAQVPGNPRTLGIEADLKW